MSKPQPFWPEPSPNFVQVRAALRRALATAEGAPHTESAYPGVVIGLSGGPDSLALVAAAAAERISRRGVLVDKPVHAVVVDHGLQPNSAQVAQAALAKAQQLGASGEIVAVTVTDTGTGPEAAARQARQQALHQVARARRAPLLLAHTLDDQAETVLLRLARGGGPKALAGMGAEVTFDNGVQVLRPLLGLRRAATLGCCQELGLQPWQDPHNDDPRFTRVRVRHRILPLLEAELGPGVAENLAKTATVAAADNAVLDTLAQQALTRLSRPTAAHISAENQEGTPEDALADSQEVPLVGLEVAGMAELAPALAARVVAAWVHSAGGRASSRHIASVLALVENPAHGPVAVARSAQSSQVAGTRLVVRRKNGTLLMTLQ